MVIRDKNSEFVRSDYVLKNANAIIKLYYNWMGDKQN